MQPTFYYFMAAKLQDCQGQSTWVNALFTIHMCLFDYDLNNNKEYSDQRYATHQKHMISLLKKSLVVVDVGSRMHLNEIKDREHTQTGGKPYKMSEALTWSSETLATAKFVAMCNNSLVLCECAIGKRRMKGRVGKAGKDDVGKKERYWKNVWASSVIAWPIGLLCQETLTSLEQRASPEAGPGNAV